MSRQEQNKELVKLLSELIEQHPDLRFSQILFNFGFVKQDRPANPNLGVGWQNEFYLESEKVLKRVLERLENAPKSTP